MEKNTVFIQNLVDNPVKVNNASLVEIKIALDDTLVKYFQEVLGYTQDHRLTDKSLLIQFILNVLSGLTALYAYYVPFVQARYVLGFACAVFFVLNTIWGIYHYFIIEHFTFIGYKKEGVMIMVQTEMQPPSTMYTISIKIRDTVVITIQRPVESWFDVSGTLDPVPIAQDLKELLSDESLKKKTQ